MRRPALLLLALPLLLAGRSSDAGADGVAAPADGLGADGLGADGPAAEGVAADGLGAEGLGALGAAGREAPGFGADAAPGWSPRSVS